MVEQVAEPATAQLDLDSFVQARGRALWRCAWLLTGDHHRAEDLVQTALAKTYHRLPSLGTSDAYEAYLRTTMYHTYLAWWRRRWTGELPSEVLEHAEQGVDLELRHDVAQALAALPRGQRAVVVLCYFEDLTQAQAAVALQISVGTVKSQLSRALAALRTSPLLSKED